MLQTIILLTFTLACIKVYILQNLNATKFRTKRSFGTKWNSRPSNAKLSKKISDSNGKTRWRGIRSQTLELAENLLPGVGKKLLLISHRSSDQAAKRNYHSSSLRGIREQIGQAEELDKQLKIQRSKSLVEIEGATDRQSVPDKSQLNNGKLTKKKPGRPTNPAYTKTTLLAISKEKHTEHSLKDHGLGSHTVIDLEASSAGPSGSYQWNLEVTKYEFRRINCLDCNEWLSPKGGWTIPKGSLYGYSIRALVITWRMSLGISYADCANILSSLFSLHEVNMDATVAQDYSIPIPNKDTMKNWVMQASETFSPQLDSLHQRIQRSKALYIDETPISLNGECWFVWVVCTANSYYYVLKPSKGLDALKEVVVGCEPMVVVTDDAAIYNAKRLRELLGQELELQKCVVHVYRVLGKSLRTIISELKTAKKKSKKGTRTTKVLSEYQQKLLVFIPKFIELFSLDTRARAEEGLKKLYQQLELPQKGNLKSIWEHRNELFVYKDPKFANQLAGQLQKTNNIAEQGMRIVARMRKRIRCFRSDKCLQAELSMLSLYATVSCRKQDFTKFMLNGLKGNLSNSFDAFELANPPDPPDPPDPRN